MSWNWTCYQANCSIYQGFVYPLSRASSSCDFLERAFQIVTSHHRRANLPFFTISDRNFAVRRYLHTRPTVTTNQVMISFAWILDCGSPGYGMSSAHIRRKPGTLPPSSAMSACDAQYLTASLRDWKRLTRCEMISAPMIFSRISTFVGVRQGGLG